MTRLNPVHAKAYAMECKRLGISRVEGVRQLVANYLADPGPLPKQIFGSNLTEVIANATDTQANVDAIKQVAARNNLTHGEVIRALIQRYTETL